jgi:hypothetical protein
MSDRVGTKDSTQQVIQKYFGIVAMIDALGVSNYSIDECKIFIENLKEIDREKNRFIESLIASQRAFMGKSPSLSAPEYISNVMENVKVSQFGDTIILAWPIEKKFDLNNLLVTFFASASIVGLIHKGLQLKIPFRGCISVGEFIWDDTDAKILGPAIADVSNWYDAADWFGVIFSPKANHWLSTLLEVGSPKDDDLLVKMFRTFLCSYDVPLKNVNNTQRKETLFVAGWPLPFYYFPPEGFTTKQIFYRVLFELPMPKGTESKFKNSENFFIWYGSEVYEKNKDQWRRGDKSEEHNQPAGK